MVDRAQIVPDDARIVWTRQVILWCVEAYFGQLGGVAVSRDREASGRTPLQETTETSP